MLLLVLRVALLVAQTLQYLLSLVVCMLSLNESGLNYPGEHPVSGFILLFVFAIVTSSRDHYLVLFFI